MEGGNSLEGTWERLGGTSSAADPSTWEKEGVFMGLHQGKAPSPISVPLLKITYSLSLSSGREGGFCQWLAVFVLPSEKWVCERALGGMGGVGTPWDAISGVL